MKKIYVVGNNAGICAMFEAAGYECITSVTRADLFCFTGGADVSPFLYGETNVASRCDGQRDFFEMGLFHWVKSQGKPMVGICRGGQFLNVMNGGKLWQDVDGHATGFNHPLFDPETNEMLCREVSSTHHQMMIPAAHGVVLAHGGNFATRLTNEEGTFSAGTHGHTVDIEVVSYPETKSLCFQPHPEFFSVGHPCTRMFLNMVGVMLG